MVTSIPERYMRRLPLLLRTLLIKRNLEDDKYKIILVENKL